MTRHPYAVLTNAERKLHGGVQWCLNAAGSPPHGRPHCSFPARRNLGRCGAGVTRAGRRLRAAAVPRDQLGSGASQTSHCLLGGSEEARGSICTSVQDSTGSCGRSRVCGALASGHWLWAPEQGAVQHELRQCYRLGVLGSLTPFSRVEE